LRERLVRFNDEGRDGPLRGHGRATAPVPVARAVSPRRSAAASSPWPGASRPVASSGTATAWPPPRPTRPPTGRATSWPRQVPSSRRRSPPMATPTHPRLPYPPEFRARAIELARTSGPSCGGHGGAPAPPAEGTAGGPGPRGRPGLGWIRFFGPVSVRRRRPRGRGSQTRQG
jgi:hypothetical protein